jgi:tetratricopeptide (TPR) repeat protein
LNDICFQPVTITPKVVEILRKGWQNKMDEISVLLDNCRWKDARRLMKEELKQKPRSHWLWTNLAMTYYEEKKYTRALELNEKAMQLAPNCPLVLWHYACTLDMAGGIDEAIFIWKKILNKGINRIAWGVCGEGVRWSRTVINDCRFRLSLAFQKKGNTALASRYMRKHIANRRPGIPSLYSMKEAKEIIRDLIEEREKNRSGIAKMEGCNSSWRR